MALDVYFREDIRAIVLASVVTAINSAQAHGGTNVEFVRGVLCEAQHTALAFGVSWPVLLDDARQEIGQDMLLLDAILT